MAVSAAPRSTTCPYSSNQRTVVFLSTRDVQRAYPPCRCGRPFNTCDGPPLFLSQCKGCGAGILLHPICKSSLADTVSGLPSLSSINRASYIGQKIQNKFSLSSIFSFRLNLCLFISLMCLELPSHSLLHVLLVLWHVLP